jgi:ABC-type bacteriocin/lantibiotic exporter with double-glycine peptidase domain
MLPTPPAPEHPPTLREALRYLARLMRLVRPYWRGLGTGIILGSTVGVIGLITPYLSKVFIDTVYPSRDVALMHLLVLGLLVASVASTIMSALRSYHSQVLSAQMGSATNLLFLNHVQHLPARFFDEHSVGEVLSRFGDVRTALSALTNIIQTVLGSGIYLLLAPPVLLLLNWKLALVSLVTVPVTTLVATLSGRGVRRYWQQSAEASAALSALQVEVFNHIRTLKTLAVEHHVYRTASRQTEVALRAQLTAGGLGVLVGLFNGVVRTGGMAFFTWYAWRLVLRDAMTLGDFVAFSAYIGFLTGPVNQIMGLFSQFQQTAVTLGRMFEYIAEPPEQQPELAYRSPPPIPRVRGELRLDRVSFGYVPARPVLHDVSLTLAPGTVTALVGPSGAGKSSVVRLLCRMVDPTQGRILLDGVPIDATPLRDLRRQLAVVSQEPAVLRGTVWENLTYGLDDAQSPRVRARVADAVGICRLDESLRDLPNGYETSVAEFGATLSGGQRQRLAIARALVRDAAVLLLDEATSQVDVGTEEEILRDLFTNVRDRTVLFVTHRVCTAALADQVCVLNAGGVVGVGNHRDLATSCEVYRRLLGAAGRDAETRSLKLLGR